MAIIRGVNSLVPRFPLPQKSVYINTNKQQSSQQKRAKERAEDHQDSM